MPQQQDNHNLFRLAFALVTSLFFLWAIAHNLNDILIKQFQKALDLSRGQAGFIQFAFYLTYFFTPIPAGLLMKKLGFKKTMIIGLLLYAGGAVLFYPAAEVRSYGFFLVSLFIIASGSVFLETSGSAYITLVGDKATSVRRINFSQSFNGLGAVIAPTVGGLFIFSGIEYSPEQLTQLTAVELDNYRAFEARQVQMPYLFVAAVVLIIALLIALTPFPHSRASLSSPAPKSSVLSILRINSFRAGLVSQFFYVGAQITVWSYFIDFALQTGVGLSEKNAAYLLSVSLLLFMVGRFASTFVMKYVAPVKLLIVYAIAALLLVLIALCSTGWLSLMAMILTSFFMSIMFPTIYALGLRELGEHAPVGSSLIIMTIISGAFLPPVMGYISDLFSIQVAYIVPMCCFLVVFVATYYGQYLPLLHQESQK